MRSLSADSRFLDSAKRGHFVEDETVVDTDHAAFKCLHNPECAPDVLCIKVCRQPRSRVVRKGNRLVLILEREYARNRSQNLIPAHAHFRTDASQYSR